MIYITIRECGRYRSETEHILYYPGDPKCCAISVQLNKTLSEAGSLRIVVPSANINKWYLRSCNILTVYNSENIIWRGFIRDISKDFSGNIDVFCIEDIEWLNNVHMIPGNVGYSTAVRSLQRIIGIYNDYITANDNIVKLYEMGECTWDRYLGNSYIEYGSTIMDAINIVCPIANTNNKCIEIRRTKEKAYIDFKTLSDYTSECTQRIQFGENFLNYVESLDFSNLCNTVMAYGAEMDDTYISKAHKKRYTPSSPSVNNGSVIDYGVFAKSIIYDDAESATDAYNLGMEYVEENSEPVLTLEISALDLNYIDSTKDSFDIGDAVQVIAKPFDIDMKLVVTGVSMDLQNPQNNKYVLSGATNLNRTLTQQIFRR